jgi:hypothetical protein
LEQLDERTFLRYVKEFTHANRKILEKNYTYMLWGKMNSYGTGLITQAEC